MKKILTIFALLFIINSHAQLRETEPIPELTLIQKYENVPHWEMNVFDNEWKSIEEGYNSAIASFKIKIESKDYLIFLRYCSYEFDFFAIEDEKNEESLLMDSGYHLLSKKIVFLGSVSTFSYSDDEEKLISCGTNGIGINQLSKEIVKWHGYFKDAGFQKHERTMFLNYFSNGNDKVMFIPYMLKVNKSTKEFSQENCIHLNINDDYINFSSKEVLNKFHNEMKINEFASFFSFFK